jgi:hypothetical protein
MSLALFQAITRLLPNPVLLCVADGQILAANAAATRFDARLHPGYSLFDLDTEDTELLRTRLGQWLRSGTPLPGALLVKGTDGHLTRFRCHGARARWFNGPHPAIQLHLAPLDHTDQFVVLSQQVIALNREVAFRRAAEAERERLLAAEQTARTRLQHLYRLTAALASAATLDEVAEAVLGTAPAALNATSVGLNLHSQRLIPDLGPADRRRALAGSAWHDLDQRPYHAGSRPGAAQDSAADTVDVLEARTVLIADQLMLGTLMVHYRPGTPPEPEHLTAIAQLIAQAVRRTGLYEHEHRVAERLQLSLLPHLPDIAGLQIAASYAPGTGMTKVGGDWYDAYDLGEDYLGLSIGDVAGHGLREAAVMVQITAALRTIVARHGTQPALVVRELNDFLQRNHPDCMATVCYLVFNRRTGMVRYAKAGHPPPLLIHADGTSRYLDEALAPPVGPFRHIAYREAEISIEPDDTLLLYTDGLIERRGENLDTGLDRLTATAHHSVDLSIRDLCDLFLNHQPHATFADDRALLAARFDPPADPA